MQVKIHLASICHFATDGFKNGLNEALAIVQFLYSASRHAIFTNSCIRARCKLGKSFTLVIIKDIPPRTGVRAESPMRQKLWWFTLNVAFKISSNIFNVQS